MTVVQLPVEQTVQVQAVIQAPQASVIQSPQMQTVQVATRAPSLPYTLRLGPNLHLLPYSSLLLSLGMQPQGSLVLAQYSNSVVRFFPHRTIPEWF